jgi:uncharacterized protein (DUF2249 family)
MKISSKTKISKLIDHNPETIEVISEINKHFKKLKNPFLRKALAPRVTVAEAAKIGGVPVCVMIDKLRSIGFETSDDCGCEAVSPKEKYKLTENKTEMRKKNIVELDVRPSLEKGIDPFNEIMSQLKKMDDEDTLKIINTFEPIPLLNLLKEKGYVYETERPEQGLVYTYLEKAEGEKDQTEERTEKPELLFEEIEKQYSGHLKEIDVRDLEMPLPMVTILEEVEKLSEGQGLYVHHKRLPQYLLPELENRGFKWVSKEEDKDNVKLIIFK